MPSYLPNLSLSSRFLIPLLIVVFLVIFHLHSSPKLSSLTPSITPNVGGGASTDARSLFLSFSASANSSISSHLRALTREPHLAGTPSAAAAADYVHNHLKLAGLETLTRNYSVSLSYPADATLSILLNGTLVKTLSLSEPADPAARVVAPYHSYSPSGSALAPAVYANLGRDEDYLVLDRLSVDVRGCVVVLRRGGGSRGAIVVAAAARGAKAVLMFGKGVGGGVERGTVLLGGPGDPLTPGWAANATAERLTLEDGEVRKRFPKIPSMPVPTVTAVQILGAIGGPPAPPEWKAEMSAVVGVGGGSTMVNFTYQIGSTEWVEQNLGILESKAVVYLNLDCAVQGPGFYPSASPQLDELLIEIMKQVADPSSDGMSVYQTWEANNGGISKIERLSRADSDFTAFLHHAGVPATDIYFGEDYPFYHTSLDTYEWMEKHGDPSFLYHVAASEIWGLLGLRLSDDRILPFDYNSYSSQLLEHANALIALFDGLKIDPILSSIQKFTAAAKAAQDEAKMFKVQGLAEDDTSSLRLRAFNDRLMLTERAFLDPEGLRGRPWFRHLLYSPPKDGASKLSFFPGIADAISDSMKSSTKGEMTTIEHEIWRVARAIRRAADVLQGELT
ncbi:probable glutamate carboxypeptidase VP8 isoform X2 [Phalaenopsis equestris]|uniref:probable glutamate carboxypeptidase VP8 isoform X2 n=1 Tax=Phalaenopsis equestris TaxID=78828 RepID=UPI0009E21A87|nr:probable glutamate carboxypeptidase VP8 isoform X2 [Phalaenopsis equestris]